MPAPDFSEWEQNAGWWQEHFTDGADPEYEEQILPLVDVHLAGKRRVLDVGCGEGQLARRIAALGAAVVGVDPTSAQIVEASTRAGGPQYARGSAIHLPVRSAAFIYGDEEIRVPVKPRDGIDDHRVRAGGLARNALRPDERELENGAEQ